MNEKPKAEEKKNCRFCSKMLDWQYDDEQKMNSFNCTYWEKKLTVKGDYCVWVYPEMEFCCPEFYPKQNKAAEEAASKVVKLEKKVEALEKELKKYQ